MDAEAQPSLGRRYGKSGEARGKDSELNLGGLASCSAVPNNARRQRRRAARREVSRGRSSALHRRDGSTYWRVEGPNSLMQGADWKDSMDAERQQGGFRQQLLFEELTDNPRHDARSNGGTEAAAFEESQPSTAFDPSTSLDHPLSHGGHCGPRQLEPSLSAGQSE